MASSSGPMSMNGDNKTGIGLSLSRLTHWLLGREAHPKVVQGTADLHHEVANTLFPQTEPVFHNATALHATNQWC